MARNILLKFETAPNFFFVISLKSVIDITRIAITNQMKIYRILEQRYSGCAKYSYIDEFQANLNIIIVY